MKAKGKKFFFDGEASTSTTYTLNPSPFGLVEVCLYQTKGLLISPYGISSKLTGFAFIPSPASLIAHPCISVDLHRESLFFNSKAAHASVTAAVDKAAALFSRIQIAEARRLELNQAIAQEMGTSISGVNSLLVFSGLSSVNDDINPQPERNTLRLAIIDPFQENKSGFQPGKSKVVLAGSIDLNSDVREFAAQTLDRLATGAQKVYQSAIAELTGQGFKVEAISAKGIDLSSSDPRIAFSANVAESENQDITVTLSETRVLREGSESVEPFKKISAMAEYIEGEISVNDIRKLQAANTLRSRKGKV